MNTFAKSCALLIAALLLLGAQALAHCDTLDGPVVQSAQKALDSGNVKLVLIWVQKNDEPEVKQAPAADKALREGKVEALLKLLRDAQEDGVHRHFEAALKKRDFARDDVEAGRQFVKAYVQYIHCVEALYDQATQEVHGHYHRESGTVTHHEE